MVTPQNYNLLLEQAEHTGNSYEHAIKLVYYNPLLQQILYSTFGPLPSIPSLGYNPFNPASERGKILHGQRPYVNPVEYDTEILLEFLGSRILCPEIIAPRISYYFTATVIHELVHAYHHRNIVSTEEGDQEEDEAEKHGLMIAKILFTNTRFVDKLTRIFTKRARRLYNLNKETIKKLVELLQNLQCPRFMYIKLSTIIESPILKLEVKIPRGCKSHSVVSGNIAFDSDDEGALLEFTAIIPALDEYEPYPDVPATRVCYFKT